MAKKNDTSALVKKIDFDDNLKKLNKKVSSNKAKHVAAKKEITNLIKEIVQISEKGYDFLLDRMYFTENDGYQNSVGFGLILSSLILDGNKRFINWR